MSQTKKELLLSSTADAVLDLLYEDRKDDQELNKKDVSKLIKNGEVKPFELVRVFMDHVISEFEDHGVQVTKEEKTDFVMSIT